MEKAGKKEKHPEFSKIVVIGASYTGLDALKNLLSQLRQDFPLPLLVVNHISADSTAHLLLKELNDMGTLTCQHAINGKKLRPGYLYLAPSDHHLMIDDDQKIRITKGAMENRVRPAIDPLFRSAAVTFGNGVIGVLLTGYPDDGTAGMKMINRCGGISILQDPYGAGYPNQQKNSHNAMKADYFLPVSEMGDLIYRLIPLKLGKQKPVPKEIAIESSIAEQVLSDLATVNELGSQVPFNCPGCGGALWRLDKNSDLRFRCHTGHAYTAVSLLSEQNKKIEETLWTALRMFEERKNLLHEIGKGKTIGSKSALEKAHMSQVHVNRIRLMLKADDRDTMDEFLL